MKKVFIWAIVIIAVSALAGCTGRKENIKGRLLSPGFDDAGKAKILQSMFNADTGKMITFQYDNENRLVTISHYQNGRELDYTHTITYNSDTVTVENKASNGEEFADGLIHYVIDRNTITYSYGNTSGTMTVNNEGLVLTDKAEWLRAAESHDSRYEYWGGNLTSKTEVRKSDSERYRETVTIFRYDNKSSPFLNDKTPKWLLQHIISGLGNYSGIGFNNNITFLGDNITELEYKYEYDSDGFPAKQIRIHAHGGIVEYETTIFTYSNPDAVG